MASTAKQILTILFPVSKRITRGNVAFLLTIGFVSGVLLNQYGFFLENIRVDVTITVAEETSSVRLAKQLKHSALLRATKTTFVVPNIVHFIWFTDDDSGKRLMTITEYMSTLSVYRVQQPDQIQFHCSRLPEPEDFWWNKLWNEIPLRIVYHEKAALIKQLQLTTRSPKDLYKRLAFRVLLENGGIFVDWSILVVKNLDPFRQYDVTLGKESSSSVLSTDIVAARRNATFLRILLDSTSSIEPCDVDCSARTLSLEYPDLFNTVFLSLDSKQSPQLYVRRIRQHAIGTTNLSHQSHN